MPSAPPSMAGPVSTVVTTVTSSSTSTPPANAPEKAPSLTPTEISEIVLGCLAFCLLVVFLVYVFFLRRPRQKYQHPGDSSKVVDTLESATAGSVSKSYREDWPSSFEHSGGDTLRPLQTQQKQDLNRTLVNSDSRYFKDAYITPATFVNDYEGRETDVLSLHDTQSSETTKSYNGFEPATLLSARPSLKLVPLNIPEKPLNPSNRKHSMKRKASRRLSKTCDSDWETDDSASLYSEASASASTHSSISSVGTITLPPPVPPIPLHFSEPREATLPEAVDAIVSPPRWEEAIIKTSPTIPLLTHVPTLKFNREEGEDNPTQIHNVAKLLHSRQSRLPQPHPPSRNSSIVSHIERSGSIRPALLPTGEEGSESYRPRYNRVKQNRNSRTSYASNISATHPADSSVSMPPSSYSQVES